MLTVAAIGLFLAASVVAARANHPNALWHVVHYLCVPNKRVTGLPTPCSAVDRRRGIAVVKDFGGPTGFLLVPTRRITGVEDPQLLDPATPNYWEDAWKVRGFVQRRAGRTLARDEIGMAINAPAGRTQNQLHIHVDCIRPEVRDDLRRRAASPPGRWVDVQLLGHSYRAIGLSEDDLHDRSPFLRVADLQAAGSAPIGTQTMVVVGATLPNDVAGFQLLTAPATPANHGHGEDLIDHRCAILR